MIFRTHGSGVLRAENCRGRPLQVPAGRGRACSLHPEGPSPSEHAQDSGPGYKALRMARTLSQTPTSVLPEFTCVPGCIMMTDIPVTLFSQPRTLHFDLLLALTSPLKPNPMTPSSRKFLHPSQQALGTALWLPSLHRILDDCSFVCLAHWAVVVVF